MRLNIEHITQESRFWNRVNALAKEAFPPEEYLAPSELVKMARSDNFDFLALLDGDSFVGFMVVQTFMRIWHICSSLPLMQTAVAKAMAAELLKP